MFQMHGCAARGQAVLLQQIAGAAASTYALVKGHDDYR